MFTMTVRQFCHSLALGLLAIALQGCGAYGPHTHDPFGRARSPQTQLPAMYLQSCTPRDVDVKPYLESGTRPMYPAGELMAGRAGSAVFVFEVAADGKVTPAPFNHELGYQWFLRHAIIASSDWQARPALKNGQPVAVQCRLRLDFELWRPDGRP